MRIVFYSTNASDFDLDSMHIYNFPENKAFWTQILSEKSDYDITFVTQLPALFLVDYKNNEVTKNDKIKYLILDKNATSDDFVNSIIAENPECVIATSFWNPPFDWLSIQDAIIGEKLKEKKLKVICHDVETNLICFDKNRTYNFLTKHNFNAAKSVYVNHELFWAERNRKEVIHNVYKESVFYEISKLKLPLIIKDTCGLSSYGMEVCTTYGQVKNFLNSKKNNSDRMVEEFVSGIQFGVDLFVYEDKVIINSPFMFSVNQYGITSPKQSVKIGPINNEKYKINELKSELGRLVKELKLNGFAQIDLVFSNDKWFIIEINPRLSGMTEISKCNYLTKSEKFLVALKFPVLTDAQLEKLMSLEYLHHITQFKNDAALQRREQGYCEVILYAKDLDKLKKDVPEFIETSFFETAKAMYKSIIDV